jgi:hypothetical protein
MTESQLQQNDLFHQYQAFRFRSSDKLKVQFACKLQSSMAGL